jgi:hypothetical protein
MESGMSKIYLGFVALLVFSAVAMGQTKASPKKNLPPPLEIGRGGAGTPEITGMHPASIENGKETEVVVKGRDFPSDAKLEASRDCRLISAKLISATEARFTVVSTTEKNGYCRLEIIGKKKRTDDQVEVKPTAAYQVILDKQKEEQKKADEARRAKEMQDAQAGADFMMKTAPELVGKSWAVKLPNGQSETWTFASKSTGGGKFTSPSLKQVMIVLQQNGDVMVIPDGGGCLMQGKFKDGKASGEQSMPASMCKLGAGKWSATVSK